MIGEIRKVLLSFYNSKSGKMEIKSRPALIIARADQGDYVILPISTITHKNNRSADYDIEIDPTKYPKLELDHVSYVRTHKQNVAHAAEIGKMIGNIKIEYEDLYLEILEKREKFSAEITRQAL